jgi:hypothetical protein
MKFSSIIPEVIGVIRAALENDLDRSTRSLAFWTAVVVIGLILEYLADAGKWLKGKVKRQSPYAFAWISFWSFLGGVCVVVGVAGELFVGVSASKEEGRVRNFNNDLVSSLQKQAAEAIERASKADAKASGYQSQIEDAKARVKTAEAASKEAVAKVSNAEARIAEAQRGVEEAKRDAEAEKLERVRLQAIVAPRSLTRDQQRQIADACRPFIGHRAQVNSYGMDGESLALGTQILSLLRSVLGDENVLDRMASVNVTGDFDFGVHVRTTSREESAFATTLGQALKDIGHIDTAVNDPYPAIGSVMGGVPPTRRGTPFPAGTTFLDVMVGIKPVPIL